MRDLTTWVAGAQAVYFVATGAWPLVHIPSFLAVTGPKTDLWLVRTVGVLVLVIGVVIGLAAYRGGIDGQVITLAIGGAVALTAVDVIYVLKRVIPRIYLLDAVVEVVLMAAWAVALSMP